MDLLAEPGADSTRAAAGEQRSYRVIALLTGIFLFFIAVNPAMVADLRAYSFDDGSYSHAYLIVPVIVWLYWDLIQRERLVLSGQAWMLPALAVACYVLFAARLAQFSLLERLLIPLPLLAALATVFRPSLALLLPAALLWFITPVWGSLNPWLQELSTWGVEGLMRQTGIPTFVEGNFVQIPAGTFEIAEGCSGLRYVISALAIAVIYCHLFLTRPRNMLLFIIAAVLGSILTNWLRIAALVLIGHFTDMQSSLIGDHNMFGWFLFVPLMLLLIWFGDRLEPARVQARPVVQQPEAAGVRLQEPSIPLIAGVFALFLVFSDVGYALTTQGRLQLYVPPPPVETAKPRIQPGLAFHPVVYEFASLRRVSQSRQHSVEALHYQFAGAKGMDKPDFFLNDLLPDGWHRCGPATREEAGFTRMKACAGDRVATIDYAYRVAGKQVASEPALKLQRLLAGLAFQRGSELLWGMRICEGGSCYDGSSALFSLP